MDLPELKLPEKKTFYRLPGNKEETTLASKVRAYLLEHMHDCSISYLKGTSKEDLLFDACHVINRKHEEFRREIALIMQEHIIANHGAVDSYPAPHPGTAVTFNIEGYDTAHIFDYFGADYVIGKQGLERKTDKLIYRNAYKSSDTKEYVELMAKAKELEEEVQETAKHRNRLAAILFFIGFVYLAYFLPVFILDIAFGAGKELIERFVDYGADNSWYLISLMAALPYKIVDALFGLPKSVIPILCLAVGALALFGIVFCFFGFKESHEDNKAYSRAKAAKSKLVYSPEYKKTVKENLEQRRENERLAEQWHRAWFEWYKEGNYLKGDTIVRMSKD